MLFLATMAFATEVGRSSTFGVGVATGYPYLMGTVKYYFNEKKGIAGFIGTSFTAYDVQVEFQSEILEIHDWDFARFPLYWLAGVDVGLHRWEYANTDHYYGGVGVLGGAGVALQFHEVPAEVFAELAIGGMLLNGCGSLYGSCFLFPASHVGGRWYF